MKKGIVFLVLLVGIIGGVSAGQIDKSSLCNFVYNGIQAGLSDNQIISQIYIDTQIQVPPSLVSSYRSNWTGMCSGVTGLTLNPSSLCKKIYYLTISTNFDYSQEQLEKVAHDTGASINATFNYADNYYSLCYLTGYSSQLPAKNIPQIVVRANESCNLEKNPPFKGTIPFFNIYIGNASWHLNSIKHLGRT